VNSGKGFKKDLKMKKFTKSLFRSQIIGPFAAAMVVAILVTFTTDRFLEVNNLGNLALHVSVVSLMAIGSTFVIFTGGIDLSPGSMVALLTMVFAECIKFGHISLPLAILILLILGSFLGGINGFLTAYFRIPSFITTLAGLSAYRGMAFMFNKGSPVFSVSDSLEYLFYYKLLGIPMPFFYVVIFFALAHFVMRYTRLGRHIYAVGGNAAASKLSGINVERTQLFAFAIAGFMAAVASILMAAQLNSGSPNYGVGLELQAIAAAVIGGASLSGGRGNIISTLFGALTVAIVQNGLNLNAVPTSLQNIIIGLIILLAVLIDIWREQIGLVFRRLIPSRSP
jgi:ribose transport system permease protein